jgi:hypothetical protein
LPYETVATAARDAGIKVTEAHPGKVDDVDKFQKAYQEMTDIEGMYIDIAGLSDLCSGVVIRFEDTGEMYKCKTNWYFGKTHKEKQKFSLNSERSIWKLILNQEIDDALAFVNDPRLSEKVKAFELTLYKAIEEAAERLEAVAASHRSLPRQEYVKTIQGLEGFLPFEESILLTLYPESSSALDVILERAKKKCGTPAQLEEIRALLRGIRFYE